MNRIFCDMDGVLVDFDSYAKSKRMTGDECKRHKGAYLEMEPMPGAIAAVHSLLGLGYEVWAATKPPTGISWAYGDKAEWIFRHLPELKRRLVLTHDKGLLGSPCDYLIDDRPHKANCHRFRGTLIAFGDVEFPDWSSVLSYFKQIGRVA